MMVDSPNPPERSTELPAWHQEIMTFLEKYPEPQGGRRATDETKYSLLERLRAFPGGGLLRLWHAASDIELEINWWDLQGAQRHSEGHDIGFFGIHRTNAEGQREEIWVNFYDKNGRLRVIREAYCQSKPLYVKNMGEEEIEDFIRVVDCIKSDLVV